MPPINQGSRAALITWSVIATVLAVVLLVLAIFANNNATKLQQSLTDSQAKYAAVVDDAQLTGGLVNGLSTVKSTGGNAYNNMTLLEVANTQALQLAKRVSGSATPADAIRKSSDALKTAGALQPPPATDNLTSALDAVVGRVKSLDDQVQLLENQKKSLSAKADQDAATATTLLTAKDQEIASVRKDLDAMAQKVGTDRSSKDEQIAKIQEQMQTLNQVAENAQAKAQTQIASLSSQIKSLQQEKIALQGKLGGLRLPVDQVTRQIDGRIIRTGSNDTVYIDLGSGDQVSPGMSFEVFDQFEGVPKINGTSVSDNANVSGKGSIEITRVQAGSSECRVVRTSPGATVSAGDLIVNVVYDKNTKYQFRVFGEFDLDRNGSSTAGDADVIKRLITQWGGTVVDRLDVNTDFLVIGQTPTVPNFTEEELELPINVEAKQRAEQALSDFDSVVQRAIDLRIPILNQNRFLYFTGYYEQAAR